MVFIVTCVLPHVAPVSRFRSLSLWLALLYGPRGSSRIVCYPCVHLGILYCRFLVASGC